MFSAIFAAILLGRPYLAAFDAAAESQAFATMQHLSTGAFADQTGPQIGKDDRQGLAISAIKALSFKQIYSQH